MIQHARTTSRSHQPSTSLPSCHRLKSITIIGGFLDGVTFTLANGLNCIIGARGTGKTTALEFLRYAMDALPDQETHPAERKRIESLVRQNLAGGRVEVQVETKDGLQYTITRSWGEAPIVLTAEGSPTTISLVKSGLFKADIFSQNEVEEIADRPTSQLALIDNFEAETIAALEVQMRQVEAKLTANASQILPLQDQLASLRDELNRLPSVEEKLKKFTAVKGENSEAIGHAHTMKSLRDREQRLLAGTHKLLQGTTRGIASQIGQIRRPLATLVGPDIANGPNGAVFKKLAQQLSQCAQKVDALLEQAQSCVAGMQGELARHTTAIGTLHQSQELEFRAVVEQHKQAQGEASERAQLERLRNGLMAKRSIYDETGKQLQAARQERTQQLEALSALRDRRFAIREKVVHCINEALSPGIRVSIMQHGNAEHYRHLLEKGLRGARIKHGVVAQKIVSALWPTELSQAVQRGDVSTLVDKAELSTSQAEKVVATLNCPQVLFQLETVELLDHPCIELKDGNTYKNSLTLSTGQKCTSILPILLLDSENPLLVDQPEDNLDNGFIYGTIVESIHKIKSRRQLVFVTHNPNVPVLGDAEGVFVLASDGASGQLVGSGSVDDCKSHIVTLLEGGEDAFRMRGERYAR